MKSVRLAKWQKLDFNHLKYNSRDAIDQIVYRNVTDLLINYSIIFGEAGKSF